MTEDQRCGVAVQGLYDDLVRVDAEEVSGSQHCAVALNELCPCLLAPNSRSMPPRKQTPPPTQRGQPQRPVDTIQAPCPRLW